MALINCTECGQQISDKATTCIKCGAPVVKKEIHKCFECGTELEKGTKVCTRCGAEQEKKETIKCFECGTALENGTQTCTNCGAEQNPQPIQKEQSKAQEQPKVEQQKTKTKNNPTQHIQQPVKKKSHLLITIVIILAVLGGIFVLLFISNNHNSIPGVEIKVNQPQPEVADWKGRESSSSTVFNYIYEVDATISNKGGAGNVFVLTKVTQGNHKYEKSQSVYMSAGDVQNLTFEFPEIKLLGDSDLLIDVSAKAE